MGVQHGRLDLLMAEHLLDRTEINARFEQMGRERVPQRVQTDTLGDPCLATGPLEELAWRG
jgi:hypothetical protein